MWKWHHIIFVILLVPHMRAQEEKTTRVNIPDSKEIFDQFDAFFQKLGCPDGLLKPKGPDVLDTTDKAKIRLELLNELLSNSDLAKKCPNISSIIGSRSRPISVLREELCSIVFISPVCLIPTPPPLPTATPEPLVCTLIEQYILGEDDDVKLIKKLNCTMNADDGNEIRSWIIPYPTDTEAIPPPSPSKELNSAICSSVDKPMKVGLMKCILPNQSSIVIPLPPGSDEAQIPLQGPWCPPGQTCAPYPEQFPHPYPRHDPYPYFEQPPYGYLIPEPPLYPIPPYVYPQRPEMHPHLHP